GDLRRQVVCVNSLGEHADDDRVQTLLSVTAVAGQADTLTTGYESAGGARGLEALDDDPPERVAEAAARRAMASLLGRPAPAGRTVLIEQGQLRAYLLDRLSALKVGGRSTGNGRRESFRSRPIVRMSNTMIVPGADDPEAILRSTDRGLYVRQMGGGQVETV